MTKSVVDDNILLMFGINKIQLYIMRCLWEYDEISFVDSKPKEVGANLFSYHLNKLEEFGIIRKLGRRYVLTVSGKRYTEGIFSKSLSKKTDIKILVNNKKGNTKIINGRLLESDTKTHSAAIRIVQKKLTKCDNPNLKHIGDAYIKIINKDNEIIENTFSHIFELKNIINNSYIKEYLPNDVKEEILFVRKNADGHFFFERDYLIE